MSVRRRDARTARAAGTLPRRSCRPAGETIALVASAAALLAAPAGSSAWPFPEAAIPSPAAAAQETIREEQIPLDTIRAVEEITPELRRDLGLFPEVRGFVAARLFRRSDGGTVLEISFREDGRLVRERRSLSPEELEDFRGELDRRFAETGREGVVPQEGRGGLVLGQTLLGLGYHGWAVPAILDLDEARASVATYLLVSGASFYLPYRATRGIPVRDVHRNMTLWGGTRGIAYGLLLGGVVTGRPEYDDAPHLGLGLAGSVGGSVLGYRAVDRADPDEGTAALWTTVADVGTLAGLGTAYVSGFYDDVTRTEHDPRVDRTYEVRIASRTRPRAADGTALAASALGMALGHRLGRMHAYTVGDVYGLRSTIALGAQAALPIAELAAEGDGNRGKPYVGGMLAGGAGGLAAGVRLFRDQSFSPGSGLLLNAGHLAGGLTALGLTWIVTGDDGGELLYTTTTALGSIGGFALTYRALATNRSASDRAGGGTGSRRSAADGDRGVRLELSPGAFITGLAASRGRERASPPLAAPLLRLRF